MRLSTPSGARPSHRPPDIMDEAGFTLIEVIVVTIILAIIIGPITASLIIYMNSVNAVSSRTVTSSGRSVTQVYLPRDAMSATSVYGNSSGVIPVANTCSGATGLTSGLTSPSVVLVFDWTAQNPTTSGGLTTLSSQPYEVDYVLAVQPAHPAGFPQSQGYWLWRYAFTASTNYSTLSAASGCHVLSKTRVTNDLKYDVTTTNSALGTALGSPHNPGSATLKLVDASGNAYTVQGEARA